ncbi:MAG: hypothetical protein K6G70_01640 [Bacteroidaceae bacterium]|nr:hypothetical protein [Bacteroidaceae bacterium]
MYYQLQFMEMIVKIFFLLGAVALPVLIVWLKNRKKINETNQRTQIVLAAIEKNAETDVEDLLKKMAPQKKLLKEKLLSKLLWGGIISLLGLSCMAIALFLDFKGGVSTNDLALQYWLGGSILAVGIAFLVTYLVGKKLLAKEIEAEEKKMTTQA